MNREDSNKSFPLWIALLVLLVLGLAIYLQWSDRSPAAPVSQAIADKPVDRTPPAQPIATSKPAALEPPSMASNKLSVQDTHIAPVGLDPESARTAVQQVENSVYERATAMFEQEVVDVEWAGAYEQALREMFSQHHGLQRVSINSISCHTSMCRIEVFTPRDADADFFTAMFYDGLANFRAGALKAEAAIARRMAQGMTSVYVARKDHSLGFY